MAACLKHFPGDGTDERDQHLLPSINSLSAADWDQSYGIVYRRAIAQGVKSIMAGHILMPALQKSLNPSLSRQQLLPATLSAELLDGLLRKRLGFNGLIVSDATVMAGFTMAMSREQAVPEAIRAGCDMFLFTLDEQSDMRFMLSGIQRGIITPERLNEAAGRVLALKASLGLAARPSPPPPRFYPGTHRRWARETARAGVTLVKDTQGLLPLDPDRHRRIRLYAIGCGDPLSPELHTHPACVKLQALLERRGFQVTRFTGGAWDFAASQRAPAEQLAGADVLLYVAITPVVSNQTALRLNFLSRKGTFTPKFLQERPTLCVSLGSPFHLQDMPRVKTLVNAYGDHEAVLEAVAEALTGEIPFKGASPVDPFCGLWDAGL